TRLLPKVLSPRTRSEQPLVKWFREERDEELDQAAWECLLNEIVSDSGSKFRMGDTVVAG
ncbi:hypothetical protein BGX30_014374, partial [Mortierella sp. GBA39]